MRSRVIMVLAVTAVLLGGVMLVPAAYARLSPGEANAAQESVAAPTPAPPPPPTLAAGKVSVNFKGEFFSWALLDRESGEISGAKNMAATSSTESMLKVWFVADYLRRLGDKEPPAAMKKAASLAIRDSDDDAANRVYRAAGGSYAVPAGGQPGPVVKRAISMCDLTDTKRGNVKGYEGWWSFTRMSPRDAVRLGDCIADGTAAGPKWTEWVLAEMSKVRGSTAAKDQKLRSGGGKWGIVDGLPESITSQGPVSIKNGWTPLNYDGNWHVNCLAVTEKWSLAVMLRYPQSSGLDYGSDVCASVAAQLVTPQPGGALKVPQQPIGKL
ncbi:hypothetical protein SAMN05443287_106265 [Micromonospora phaseoli]|uniref:Beta-lactamase enzyme family protein n=1 Tax=Micromonospora phaseoli TaxID=1144548 RepID=A0A1H7AP78_9ACTN|nr:hypothetical protein [Micromonospora phaseoli]PZV96247.1 hypothetical protein CLV64_107124 [Micromonospora phaseoli]GIJ75922.1 hypothetical protein Xph01_03540 [Micromonospora phaseoli]SEJ67423.1 hypothetical protein SAMN05443287_106265 [Micromonospora phaseoli]